MLIPSAIFYNVVPESCGLCWGGPLRDLHSRPPARCPAKVKKRLIIRRRFCIVAAIRIRKPGRSDERSGFNDIKLQEG